MKTHSHWSSPSHWPVLQVHDGYYSPKVISSSLNHQESRCDQSQKDAAGGKPLTQTNKEAKESHSLNIKHIMHCHMKMLYFNTSTHFTSTNDISNVALQNRSSGRNLSTLFPCVQFWFNYTVFQTGMNETLQQPVV